MKPNRSGRTPSTHISVVRLRGRQVATVLDAYRLFDKRPDPGAAQRYMDLPENIFLLARDGRTPVGFLRGTGLLQLHTKRRQMLLYEIDVAPSHQRRGIGRALVERLLDHCRKKGFEDVFVFTSPNNRAAVRLYRSTGAVTEIEADRMFVYHLHR